MHSDQKTPFSIKGKPAYHYCAISIVDLNSYEEPIAQVDIALPNKYWVESSQKRYVPHAEDSVLGIVVDSRSDVRKSSAFWVSSTTPSSGMVTMASMRNYGYVYVPMEKSVRDYPISATGGSGGHVDGAINHNLGYFGMDQYLQFL
ncbi:hypothetical protein RIF29_30183 [Crotalaria pallida]|uniref:Uncharacterized protein n=1 Tax=Crotalaria pallida TaxID=3830 RepID=A0AAN9EL15_CROPI